MFLVSASGGTPAPLTTLDAARGETDHRWPQMLPDGRVPFLVRSDKPENSGVYAASLANPAERVRLLTTTYNALYGPGNDGKSYLLWPRGGILFAQEFDASTLKFAGEPHPVADPVAGNGASGQANATVSAGGLLLYSAFNTSSQSTWFDRTGKSLGVVGEPGEQDSFRLSPDGHRAAVTRERPGGSDLWLLEVERGVFSRFTFNSSYNLFPVWSPDGRTVAFESGLSRNLYRRESSGAGSEQRITQSRNIQNTSDWSRDGRFVLYVEVDPRTQRDLWVLPVTPDGKPAEGTQPRPYLRTPFNELWGRFSPETSPRWVAYQSDESGRDEVYIQAFPEPRGAARRGFRPAAANFRSGVHGPALTAASCSMFRRTAS